jgi:hypothetical protein
MSKREKPIVISTRATKAERALIRAIAEEEGVSVSEAIYRLLMPAVRQRIAATVAGVQCRAA